MGNQLMSSGTECLLKEDYAGANLFGEAYLMVNIKQLGEVNFLVWNSTDQDITIFINASTDAAASITAGLLPLEGEVVVAGGTSLVTVRESLAYVQVYLEPAAEAEGHLEVYAISAGSSRNWGSHRANF
jgi:hypothetical protein